MDPKQQTSATEEEVSTVSSNLKSPSKKKSPSKDKLINVNRLQLYNKTHAGEISKLLTGVKQFQLTEKVDDEDGSVADESSLNFEVSDDEDPSVAEPGTDAIGGDSSFPNNDVNEGKAKFICNTCGLSVDDISELRYHYKLDWHRYNLKRKIHGEKPVSEADFYGMMDDLSSIEGSDSENESSNDNSLAVSRLLDKVTKLAIAEDKANSKPTEVKKLINSPKVYFENSSGRIFGMYKSIAEVMQSRTKGNGDLDFSRAMEQPLNIAILMVSGGHFAAAVFQGTEVVAHKTFHSYTVRAKQGGSQGTRDAKSGGSHPKSSGASLRRYNEQSFLQHVQDLMDSWKVRLATCPLIFYRAVSSSANVLFGGKSPPFQRNDIKLRTIPFPTKRPTFTEVKRVHSFLTVLHVYNDKEQFLAEHLPSRKLPKSKPKKTIDRAKSKSPKRREDPCPQLEEISDESNDEMLELEEVTEIVDLNELKEYDDSLTPQERQTRKKPKPKKPKPEPFPKPQGTWGLLLEALLSADADQTECHLTILKNELEIDSTDKQEFLEHLNQPIDFDQSNFLHLATQQNLLTTIWDLLELGCSPATKNKGGKYPYNYATSQESRTVFRRFMGKYPDKYDYMKAQVPAPLTEDIEAEKAEKKKLLNKLKREKEKQKRQEKMAKEKELNEKERFLNLSDREKRALAAEQRILAQCKRNGEKRPVLARCFECACDMTSKVPFEYNKNIFCTTKCLADHRKKFPTPLSVL